MNEFLMIDAYTLKGKLGSGHMGAVYHAYDLNNDRDVALKVCYPGAMPDAQARFDREYRILAELSHPNIVRTFGTIEHQGKHFIVMEYVNGPHLDKLVESPMDPQSALDCIAQVASGLSIAHNHERKVIHRDIKPANILIAHDKATGVRCVKLSDFGIAKHAEHSQGYTRPGIALGTPVYMAYEVMRGLPATESSDIYSLGVTFLHALSGKVPYTGDAMEIFEQKRCEPHAQVLCKDVPDGICQLVIDMTRTDFTERISDTATLLRRIRELRE